MLGRLSYFAGGVALTLLLAPADAESQELVLDSLVAEAAALVQQNSNGNDDQEKVREDLVYLGLEADLSNCDIYMPNIDPIIDGVFEEQRELRFISCPETEEGPTFAVTERIVQQGYRGGQFFDEEIPYRAGIVVTGAGSACAFKADEIFRSLTGEACNDPFERYVEEIR